MRLRRAIVIGCLPPALASCAAVPTGPAEGGPAYSCCRDADVNRDYQPGQTLTLHWIVVPGRLTTGTRRRQVELHARLTGPYPTVTELKTRAARDGSIPGDSTFTAEPVRPSGQVSEQPVSLIAIPLTAPPGYYNLVTSVSEGAGRAGGAAIIQIVPGP